MSLQNVLRHGARKVQDVDKVPFKELFPLKAVNELTGSSRNTSNAVCLHEVGLVFTCLKSSSFNEAVCEEELKNFQKCYDASQKQISQGKSKDNSQQAVNKLMKRFCQN